MNNTSLKLKSLIYSLLTFTTVVSTSAHVSSADLELSEIPSTKRQYKLIFDNQNHNASRTWLQENFPIQKIPSTFSLTAGGVSASLPKTCSLVSNMPAIYDQGNLGSCTANAIAAAMQYDRRKQKLTDYTPSRLMIYWLERSLEGTINQDSGASLSDGIRAMIQYGACPETMWPYDDGSTQFKVQPTTACYTAAKQDMDLDKLSLASISQTLNSIKSVLYQNIPIVFGINVYSSFESATVARTGIVPMPNTRREQLLGGHALVLAGYDDTQSQFIVRNSWGTSWGQSGYCRMPYNYVINPSLSSDFWSISKVGSGTSQTTPVTNPGKNTGSVVGTTDVINTSFTSFGANFWQTSLYESILMKQYS